MNMNVMMGVGLFVGLIMWLIGIQIGAAAYFVIKSGEGRSEGAGVRKGEGKNGRETGERGFLGEPIRSGPGPGGI